MGAELSMHMLASCVEDHYITGRPRPWDYKEAVLSYLPPEQRSVIAADLGLHLDMENDDDNSEDDVPPLIKWSIESPWEYKTAIIAFVPPRQRFAIATDFGMRYMQSLCLPVACKSMDSASAQGLIDLLQCWLESRRILEKHGMALDYSEDALIEAVDQEHIPVLEWWKNSGLELKYDDNDIVEMIQETIGHERCYVNPASTRGVAVLRWWAANMPRRDFTRPRGLGMTAGSGHLMHITP